MIKWEKEVNNGLIIFFKKRKRDKNKQNIKSKINSKHKHGKNKITHIITLRISEVNFHIKG